jgi:predicted dehydrogenase
MMPLRVVLAGLGVRGCHWAEVLTRSPRCEIVAYVDPNPAAREGMNTRYGQRDGYDSVEEALALIDDIDALVLANPPRGRMGQVRAAAERGLPMLIEKPLALTMEEAADLVQIAESAGVPLMVGLNFRYLGVTKATRQVLNEQAVGVPEFARFTYERWRDGNRPDLNKYPLSMDQPMLWEQSIHHFDLMRYVYRSEPLTAMCRTWNPSWSMYESDANVAAVFTFDNGMVVNYQGTWQSGWAQPHFEWRTDCTNGILSQRHQFEDLYIATRTDETLTQIELPPHEQWITETQGLLDAFVDTVADGIPLQCSGRDHLMSLAMVQACILSSRENRCVSVASVLPQTFGNPDTTA